MLGSHTGSVHPEPALDLHDVCAQALELLLVAIDTREVRVARLVVGERQASADELTAHRQRAPCGFERRLCGS
jgi:hypothetical protein